VWADTVYMVVPVLAAYGASEASLVQFAGHRRRLRDPESGLWRARWDEDEQRVLDRHAWGTANGWVAAALVRTVGRLPEYERAPLARELRDLLDCCLVHRRPDGLFGNLLDDPQSFSESSVTAMLAYSALRGSTQGWLPQRYAAIGASLLEAVTGRLDEFGRVTGACAAPDFQRPGFSPEAQAFTLLAEAAHVGWLGSQRGG
jgi:unsaturated rhamnogalacturonyl hydrolase